MSTTPQRGSLAATVGCLAAAVGIGVVVPLLTFGFTVGFCADSADASVPSYCESGPAVGWPAAAVLCGLAGIAVIALLVRAWRVRPRRA